MFGRECETDGGVVQEAMQNEELHKALLDQLEEGVYLVDRARRILYWNTGAERISGYLAHEVAGHFCHGDLMMHCNVDGAILCGSGCPLSAVMQDGRSRRCTAFLRHRLGHRVPVHIYSKAIYDSKGALIGALELFEEAQASRAAIHALQPFGCLDDLTGAANRDYGEMRVRQALEGLNMFEIPFGWIRIGLDNVEDLEQRYGRGMIDAALKMIASTVDGNLGALDVLTRWNRTELRVEVHYSSRVELAEIAEKLVVLVRASSVDWWGDRRRVTVSITGGTAEHGDTLESLESRIDEVFKSCLVDGGNRAALAHRKEGQGPECLP